MSSLLDTLGLHKVLLKVVRYTREARGKRQPLNSRLYRLLAGPAQGVEPIEAPLFMHNMNQDE